MRFLKVSSFFSEHESLGLSFWRITAMVLTIAMVAFIGVMPQASNDFWLQAKVGEMIVHDRAIPQTVLFAFTPVKDAPFNAHEWLPSVLFYGLIQVFGEDGLPLVLGGLVLTLFAVMVRLAYLKSGGNLPWAILLATIAVGVANTRNYLRPELLTLILLALYWMALERYRRTANWTSWAAALAIVIVWANTHGSFILAPIIASVYALGVILDCYRKPHPDRVTSKATPRQFGLITVTALVCTLATPFGWELLRFVFEFNGAQLARTYIVEWMPTLDPRLFGNRTWQIGAAGLLLMVGSTLLNWKRLSAVELLMAVLFSILAMKAYRFLVYAGMVLAFVASALPPRSWSGARGKAIGFVLATGFSALTLGLAMNFGNAAGSWPHEYAHTESLSVLMKQVLSTPRLQGNVLTSYELGAELVYRAYPRLKPSIDSRIDSYGDYYTAAHHHLLLDDTLLAQFVKEYDVRYALLLNRDYAQFRSLASMRAGEWQVVMLDGRAAFLRRTTGEWKD